MERNAFENAEFEGVPQAQGYVPPVVKDLEPDFGEPSFEEPDFGEEPNFEPVAKAGGKPPRAGGRWWRWGGLCQGGNILTLA